VEGKIKKTSRKKRTPRFSLSSAQKNLGKNEKKRVEKKRVDDDGERRAAGKGEGRDREKVGRGLRSEERVRGEGERRGWEGDFQVSFPVIYFSLQLSR
jgi:hypothetical protein